MLLYYSLVNFSLWQSIFDSSSFTIINFCMYCCKTTIGDKMSWDTSPSVKGWLVVPLFDLPIENNKHPNFEWRGQRRGVDSFVLWSYPVWVQCLDSFVADCRWLQKVLKELVYTNSNIRGINNINSLFKFQEGTFLKLPTCRSSLLGA